MHHAFQSLFAIARRTGVGADARAHCDIPCKIYDPGPILIDALTIVRMIDILDDWRAHRPEDDVAFSNTIVRAVAQKEEHAIAVKNAVRVIWGDYFKAPQFAAYPELHELSHRIMLQAGAAKQGVRRQDALDLLESVNRFAEIFWATKSVKTKRVMCPYPPALEVVYPDL